MDMILLRQPMLCHLSSDAHEWITEIPIAHIYDLAKLQPFPITSVQVSKQASKEAVSK